jgi:ATP-dependent protease Clp ATPase subunit
MEGILLDAMYDLPSRTDVREAVVTGQTVLESAPLTLVCAGEAESA